MFPVRAARQGIGATIFAENAIEFHLRFAEPPLHKAPAAGIGRQMKKPTWIVQKERDKRATAAETIWLFGIHAVRDALLNPKRVKLRLLVTKNACDRLGEAIAEAGLEPELVDPRKF